MNAWFHIRTRAVWLFGAALLVVGALLVLQLGALLVWQYSIALENRRWPPLALGFLFSDPAQLSAAVAPWTELIPRLQWDWFSDPAHASSPLHIAVTALFNRLHIGAVPALIGVFLGLAGFELAVRQSDVLAAARRAKEDRLRRRRHYGTQTRNFPSDPQTPVTSTDFIEAADNAWRRERALGRQR
jgi:hypothetical protein